MKAELSSGDLARATGNTVRTVRFYEEEGLLRPAVVSEGGHRRYTHEDLERLRLILDLRELGLSICDIRALAGLRSGCSSVAEFAVRFREVLLRHLERAEARLERLERVKQELRDALAGIQERLPQNLAEACPCAVAAVAGAAGGPRIMKLLAENPACCHHQPTGSRDSAPGEEDDPLAGDAAASLERLSAGAALGRS
ncbi:MAG TPA: MerR family transcriptional regulator [Anaeromyxobacteraceae bacterium]|nr:MerR family transcriptional regulator [Anaeromyxobacteraceae bacterium]